LNITHLKHEIILLTQKLEHKYIHIKIKHYLSKYKIRNYNINEDFSVDVYEDVDLSNTFFLEFPINFRKIHGSFNCSNSNLYSLKGAPKFVKNDFNCSKNKLESLQHSPEKVGGSFNCSYNQLKNLKFAPIEVGENFNCIHNQLSSLKGSPTIVSKNFDCDYNKLSSLEFGPKEVGENFICSHNQLINLMGGPQKVGNDYDCSRNVLISLQGSPEKIIGSFLCAHNLLTNLIGGPKEVGFNPYQLKMGQYFIYDNHLLSLEGMAEKVHLLHIKNNNTKPISLEYLPKKSKGIILEDISLSLNENGLIRLKEMEFHKLSHSCANELGKIEIFKHQYIKTHNGFSVDIFYNEFVEKINVFTMKENIKKEKQVLEQIKSKKQLMIELLELSSNDEELKILLEKKLEEENEPNKIKL
jgi:hypothetical protein